MRTILVPTDFSDNAFIAAQYAASLASETNQRVWLTHVYIALYSGFQEEGSGTKQVELAETEVFKSMEELIATLKKQYPNVEIEGECIKGFMIDVVTEKLKKENISLVVMGTKGVTNVTESILGSTTYEVIKKSPVPVLVVPEDTPNFSIGQIGFFSDYSEIDLDAILKLQQVIKQNLRLKVFHFYKKGEQAEKKELSSWEKKVHVAFPDADFSFSLLAVDKVDVNAVSQVAKSEHLDLLVFTRPHKPFFEKLFTTSLTKAVANYPTVPSLFIKE